jgi:fibronectin-binding autotransporter adhesin
LYKYYGGGILNKGTLTLNDVTLAGNTASGIGGYGGGIYNTGTLTMNSGSINENTATNGGGIYSTNSQVTFDGTQVAVKSNRAHLPSPSEPSWYQGWGVYIASGTPTTTGEFDPTTQVTGNIKF